MKTVNDFLAEVASLRLQTQLDERKAFRAPPQFELPAALEVALRNRWQIAPVLARSELAVNSASVVKFQQRYVKSHRKLSDRGCSASDPDGLNGILIGLIDRFQ